MVTQRKLPTILACLATISLFLCTASNDPLSKISITSERATCSKQGPAKNEFSFKHLGNVRVELADQTTVTAQELEVICTLDSFRKKEVGHSSSEVSHQVPLDKNNSSFKKIVFSGGVALHKEDLTATAHRAEISVANKLCRLQGAVCIEHKQHSSKDLPPIIVRGNAATVKLATQEIALEGSSRNPVSTVIDLSNTPLRHQKQPQKKS